MNTIKGYYKTNSETWQGRKSENKLYLHEKVELIDINSVSIPFGNKKSFALLGYACDEGVSRNQGRIGAAKAPKVIRSLLGRLCNHLDDTIDIKDVGTIQCLENNLGVCQRETQQLITQLLYKKLKTIVLGGGHDLAYPHFSAIQKVYPEKKIGIINLDAHFDLREVVESPNSGTPFYQISNEQPDFSYLCLGIQKASNNSKLFETADALGVQYIEGINFNIYQASQIKSKVQDFMATVDLVYLTIDLDGFNTAIAPGVSAPSPFGFYTDIALQVIQWICQSQKLISTDIVELNPNFDIDNRTAKLAAHLIHFILDNWKS